MCTMPLLASRGGYDVGISGLVVAAFSFASVLFRPFTGYIAPVLPGRKSVAACLIFFSLTCLLLFLSPPILLTILLRAAQGIAMCIYGTIYGAIVSNLIPADRFQEGMGYYSIGVPAMSFFGPALGLAAIHMAGDRMMFLLLMFWTLSAGLICLNLRTEDAPVAPRLQKRQYNVFKTSFALGAVFPSAILMLVSVAHNSLVSYLSIFAAEQGAGNVTEFYLAAGCGIVSVRLLLTMSRSRIGEQPLMLPALGVLGLCLVFVPSLPNGNAMYLLAMMYGCALGIVQPGLIAMALARCPGDRRSAATATYYLGIDLGSGIGGVLWAAVAQLSGYRMIYSIAAGIVFATMIVMLSYTYQNRAQDNRLGRGKVY